MAVSSPWLWANPVCSRYQVHSFLLVFRSPVTIYLCNRSRNNSMQERANGYTKAVDNGVSNGVNAVV
jgi:hypothetical protein